MKKYYCDICGNRQEHINSREILIERYINLFFGKFEKHNIDFCNACLSKFYKHRITEIIKKSIKPESEG